QVWARELFLGYELITCTVNGPEVYRVSRILFQLLAQLEDMVIDRPGRGVMLISPDRIEQLLAGDHALRILQQILQDLELLGGQLDRFASAGQLHLGEIDSHIVEARDFRRSSPDRASHG